MNFENWKIGRTGPLTLTYPATIGKAEMAMREVYSDIHRGPADTQRFLDNLEPRTACGTSSSTYTVPAALRDEVDFVLGGRKRKFVAAACNLPHICSYSRVASIGVSTHWIRELIPALMLLL